MVDSLQSLRESLQKLREPAALLLLVVLALRLLLALGFAVVNARSGVADALAGLGQAVTDPLSAVVLVALVGSCLLWAPTSRAPLLARVALVVVGLGFLVSLLATLAWAFVVTMNDTAATLLVSRLLVLPVTLLAALVLVRLVRGSTSASGSVAPLSLPASPQADVAPKSLEAKSDPDQEPIWQPDQAAGAAWLTAGDAAAGARASGWGTPGDQGGWQPQRDLGTTSALPPAAPRAPVDPAERPSP